MSLRDAAAQFTRLYPVHPDTQPTAGWEGNCALLMARFGYAPGGVGWAVQPRAFGNAIDVANNSGPLNKNAAAAPVGAWHFWNWGVYGHVGNDLTGGGNDVFMASSFLRESWGTHIGVNSVAGYNAANRSATYLGWATNYRGGRYNIPAGTASTGSTPLEEDDMFTDDDRLAVQQIRDVLGAQGGLNMPTEKTVLAIAQRSELDLMNLVAYIYAGGPDVDATLGAPNSIFGMALAAAGKQATGGTDPATLAKQLAPLLLPSLVSAIQQNSITPDELATQLKTLPDAVIADLKSKL